MLFICCKTKLKNIFIFKKRYVPFLQNIHYLQKKSFILKNLFTEKNFFYGEKYKWKFKNICLIWEIYFYVENVCVTNKI